MDAVIDMVGMADLPQIVELYNQIFRPTRSIEDFNRRFLGRHNILQMIARVKDRPIGFFIGFELKPTTFFAWFYGVLPDFRRQGICSQLMEAAESWARQEGGYEILRLECLNSHRPVLHLSIALNYDIVGMRFDSERSDNLIIFEKSLSS